MACLGATDDTRLPVASLAYSVTYLLLLLGRTIFTLDLHLDTLGLFRLDPTEKLWRETIALSPQHGVEEGTHALMVRIENWNTQSWEPTSSNHNGVHMPFSLTAHPKNVADPACPKPYKFWHKGNGKWILPNHQSKTNVWHICLLHLPCVAKAKYLISDLSRRLNSNPRNRNKTDKAHMTTHLE